MGFCRKLVGLALEILSKLTSVPLVLIGIMTVSFSSALFHIIFIFCQFLFFLDFLS